MSRKWERMVEKNKKTINKTRAKHGQALITEAGTEPMQRFVGRVWLMPLTLVCFAIFYMILYKDLSEDDTMYWAIGISYFVLGLLIYWLRRPTLSIGKKTVSSMRFTGLKFAEASEIDAITVSPAFVTFDFNNKKTRWVFSKLMHRFDIDKMAEEAKQFAQRNQISFKEESK